MKRFLALMIVLSMMPITAITANAGIFGDANGDNVLDAKDVADTVQAVLNGEYIANADVNADGKLDSQDAAIILQKVLDSNYKMPVELTSDSTTEATTMTTTQTTTEVTTVATTQESSTETTTVETTETTTQAHIDGVITNDYELTPSDLNNNEYFTKNGDFSASNSERIRLYDNTLKFKVKGNANVYITAKHASNTTEGTRTVTLSTSNGTYLASHGYEKGVDPTEVLYATVGTGTYVISADNHINVYSIRVVLSEVDQNMEISTETESSTESTTAKPTTSTETTTRGDKYEPLTEITTTGNRIDVSNFSELRSALGNTNVDIYVLNDIDCTSQLKLNGSNANVNIIGVTKADGTSPSLNFASFRDSASGAGSGSTGIYISGSYYNFKNVIIENAPDCGVRIKGSSAGHCLFRDCVLRYNNNSGVSMTDGSSYNTFVGVDSYRNGDIVQKCGDDADGFSIKLNAGKDNYFYSCRAFDNSDDGWDSYDRGTPRVGDLYYIECLAWNNGNPEVFTGEYDYKMGYALDKHLLYVQAMLKADSSVETAYNNKNLSTDNWPQATIKLYGKTRTYAQLHSDLWGGNPNGFKFGSAETPNTSYRYIENCIAFDHFANIHQQNAKGYDQNGGSAKYDIVNGLSFDNVLNYEMGKMTALSQNGTAIEFNGEMDNSLNNLNITTPDTATQESLRAKVHSYRAEILADLNNDVIPGVKLCDVF